MVRPKVLFGKIFWSKIALVKLNECPLKWCLTYLKNKTTFIRILVLQFISLHLSASDATLGFDGNGELRGINPFVTMKGGKSINVCYPCMSEFQKKTVDLWGLLCLMPNNAMIPQEPPPPSAKPPPCAVVLKLLRQIVPKLLQIKKFPEKQKNNKYGFL